MKKSFIFNLFYTNFQQVLMKLKDALSKLL